MRQNTPKNNISLNKYLNITNREKEVLVCIANGLKTKQIAQKLYISAGTVESHRRNMQRKLDVKNTAGLIIKSLHAGYIKISKDGTVIQ